MTARRATVLLLFLLLVGIIVLGLSFTVRASEDFELKVIVNDQDISAEDTIVLDPQRDLEIELRIDNGERTVTLHWISIAVTFADVVIMTHKEPLVNLHMVPGEVRNEKIIIDPEDSVEIGGMPITTGIYRSKFELEYTVENRVEVWSQWKNIKIPGNPLTTATGAAGAVVGVGALVAVLALVKSIVAPALPAGAVLPAGASVRAMPGLHEFIKARLESITRGRAVSSIVNSAKKRIIRQKCPICESRIRHGHCYTCRQSAKEVRTEYTNKLKELAIQGGQLIASGQAATMGQLCSLLNISGKLATDVIATLRHARLIKVRGTARKVVGKAVTAGICSGLSAIIWVTVGGFAVLNAAALITILVAAIVIPFTIAKVLQIRAGRTIQGSVD